MSEKTSYDKFGYPDLSFIDTGAGGIKRPRAGQALNFEPEPAYKDRQLEKEHVYWKKHQCMTEAEILALSGEGIDDVRPENTKCSSKQPTGGG